MENKKSPLLIYKEKMAEVHNPEEVKAAFDQSIYAVCFNYDRGHVGAKHELFAAIWEVNPDVIITDPPRAGMHDDVIKTILAAEPTRIVYVSCNPATQARDLQLLSEKYVVKAVQPVDMFPHTHHVENVVLLSMKQPKE